MKKEIKTKEVVINVCYGGFGLSHQAIMKYAKLKEMKLYPEIDDIAKKVYKEKATLNNPCTMVHYYKVPKEKYERLSEKWHKEDGDYRRINEKDWYFSSGDIERDDKDLVKIVKELKDKANGRCSKLRIVKIPANVEYTIEEYDGNEHIAEAHQTWG